LISLITCTLGRKEALARLLHSLTLQPPALFELVLIDQNPPGYLDALLAPYRTRFQLVHAHTAKGLSLGRNAGLQLAQGDLVGFPDDDCWYPAGTLDEVDTLFQAHPQCAVVTGRTCDAYNVPSLSPSLGHRTSISRKNYLVCGNSNSIFARMSAVRQVGGFDERLGVGAATPFQSGEESDLVLSCLQAGMQAEYFPALVVQHEQVSTTNATDYIGRAKKYGAGYGALLRKHHFGLGHFLYRVTRTLASSVLHGARRQWTDARYKLSWARGTWSGYWNWSG
jgi:glycosyltransferase involved in cell wall biosynthesis